MPLAEIVHILNGVANLAGVQTLNGAEYLNTAMQILLGATCHTGVILIEARGPTEAMLHTGVILIEAMFPTGVTLVRVEGPKADLLRGVAGHPALDLNGHITVGEAICYRGVLHLMIAQKLARGPNEATRVNTALGVIGRLIRVYGQEQLLEAESH